MRPQRSYRYCICYCYCYRYCICNCYCYCYCYCIYGLLLLHMRSTATATAYGLMFSGLPARSAHMALTPCHLPTRLPARLPPRLSARLPPRLPTCLPACPPALQDMWEWKQANSSLALLRSRLARYNLPWLPQCSANVDRDARDWYPARVKFNVIQHKRKSLYYSVVGDRGGGAQSLYYSVVGDKGGGRQSLYYSVVGAHNTLNP